MWHPPIKKKKVTLVAVCQIESMAVRGESGISVGRQALNLVKEAGNLPAGEPGGGVGAETVTWGCSLLALPLVLSLRLCAPSRQQQVPPPAPERVSPLMFVFENPPAKTGQKPF